MHIVAVLALNGVVGFDLTVPCQVFGSTLLPDGSRAYDVRVCGTRKLTTVTAAGLELYQMSTPWPMGSAREAGTIVVPGVARPLEPIPRATLAMLRAAVANGTRVLSICTGAFTLGQAGVLDGRRATTHWLRVDELAARNPEIRVDASVLFVGDGAVFTSAGVAAGIDLCLHIVERDHGSAVAADTARRVVASLRREGGQAQFIDHPVAAVTDIALGPTLSWLADNLAESISLQDIAAHACMSVRTLTRRFHRDLGTSPSQWLLRIRLRRARELLETSSLPVEQVASMSGFGSAGALRQHFASQLGTSPQGYRRSFNTTGDGRPQAATARS